MLEHKYELPNSLIFLPVIFSGNGKCNKEIARESLGQRAFLGEKVVGRRAVLGEEDSILDSDVLFNWQLIYT